jgi:DNA polymerase beta
LVALVIKINVFPAELAEYESKVTKNTYKSRAYNQAAAVLARQEKKISSGAEAKKLKGIGDKIGKKIDEYLATGTMTKLENVQTIESLDEV